MTGKGIVAAALLLCMVGPPRARGGLYTTEEPPQGKQKIPEQGIHKVEPARFVRDYLAQLMLIGTPQLKDTLQAFLHADATTKTRMTQEKPELPFLEECYKIQQKYRVRKDELLRKSKRGGLSLEDRINLSFYVLRLGESPDEVLGLLKNPEVQARRHFMVFANLAAAYERLAAGAANDRHHLGNALLYHLETTRSWPREWPGWSKDQLDWYNEAEQEQTKLVRLRWREAAGKANQPPRTDGPPFEDVDALFGVKFVGESGAYEAGKIAPAQRAKLDQLKGKDAKILVQLLAWSPVDTRLYWLLGELLNARGEVVPAARILEDCVKNRGRSDVRLLREHRRVLNEAAAKLRPKGFNLPDVANTPQPESGWAPQTWQWLLAGTLGVIVIAFLAYFQIKELRRRRQRTAAGPKP